MANGVRKAYLDRVAAALPCPRAVKRVLLRQLSEDAENYLADRPDADVAELEAALGSPEAFAEDYLASLDTKKLQATLRRAKRRKRIILICCCVLLTLLLAWSVCNVIHVYRQTKDNRIVEETTVIDSTESEAVAP